MTGSDIAAWATSAVSLIAAVTALVRARNDKRRGISSDEREARRDTIADRDSLLERMERRITTLEQRLDAAEEGNIAKALVIKAQDSHMDVLEDWIWQRKAPPPPARPDIAREVP